MNENCVAYLAPSRLQIQLISPVCLSSSPGDPLGALDFTTKKQIGLLLFFKQQRREEPVS